MESTTVKFGDNPAEILKAYIKCGEGIDRAGGFAIQVSHPSPCRIASDHNSDI